MSIIVPFVIPINITKVNMEVFHCMVLHVLVQGQKVWLTFSFYTQPVPNKSKRGGGQARIHGAPPPGFFFNKKKIKKKFLGSNTKNKWCILPPPPRARYWSAQFSHFRPPLSANPGSAPVCLIILFSLLSLLSLLSIFYLFSQYFAYNFYLVFVIYSSTIFFVNNL